jgi:hypothetical protein
MKTLLALTYILVATVALLVSSNSSAYQRPKPTPPAGGNDPRMARSIHEGEPFCAARARAEARTLAEQSRVNASVRSSNRLIEEEESTPVSAEVVK